MGRAASNFRQTDVARAILAAKAAGLAVQRVEIQDGKIVVVTAPDGSMAAPAHQGDEWDRI
jgi:hypothetical protein